MCEVPKELGVSGRCLPFTKAMNDDSPSKCTTVSSVANATTPAAKWATSTTVLTNSTIPFNELELSHSDSTSKIVSDDDDFDVGFSMNESLKPTKFNEMGKEEERLPLSNTCCYDNNGSNTVTTTKLSSLELEIDLQAVKGIMGSSIVIKGLDSESLFQPKEISSTTVVDKGSGGGTLSPPLQQQRKDTRHPSIIASSKLSEFLKQKCRVSYSGKASLPSSGLDLSTNKRRASYGGAKRSFITKKKQGNSNNNIVCENMKNESVGSIKAEVVEDRNEKHSLLEEAMEEVIEDLASITEALESVQAERELNEDILCDILDRIGQIERKINHKEEEGPTMATKTSSHAVNTSALYKVHMNKEENIEGRGVKECNAIATNDASDMLEKISDFHREEIANVKQMLVL